MGILFFGTSAFAAQILTHLLKNSFPVTAVVTQPDRPRGRHLHAAHSPVKEVALASGLPLMQPEKVSTADNIEIIKKLHPDLFLVVAYGEIIKKSLLDVPRLGAYNIHASLLPKYRGAAPIQRCLMDGEEKTGINIIEMTPQMDAGDVLASVEVPIGEETTFGELEATLCAAACDLTVDFLTALRKGPIRRTPQDPACVTFAPKLQAEDEQIHWNQPARAVHNRIRALSPRPGAWCWVRIGEQEKRLKIKRATWLAGAHHATPGSVLICDKQRCTIACESGALELIEVQLEGKKAMPVAEFLKGIHQPISFLRN